MWETIIFAFSHKKYSVFWKRGKWIIYTWTIVHGYGGIIVCVVLETEIFESQKGK
jgi:hypothetical protein